MSRPVPILLIHGFNGVADNWEVSNFRNSLIARGADPDLVRVFHYGWREESEPVAKTIAAMDFGAAASEAGRQRIYNNQGDIRMIAARLVKRGTSDPQALQSQLKRLSEASVSEGGPEKVTIIAHSMGGLVARYYLSRSTPDEWGTVNEGVVGRLITIATPHLGVDLARVINLVPPDAFIWKVLRLLERLSLVPGEPSEELAQLNAQVLAMQAEEAPVMTQGYFDSPAVRQMIPGSDFLRELNAPGAFPPGVETALIWGDVRFTGGVRWGKIPLWERTISLGDLLILAPSASTLPNVTGSRHPFVWEQSYQVQLGDPGLVPASLSDYLPPVSHSNLLHSLELQETIARLVGL